MLAVLAAAITALAALNAYVLSSMSGRLTDDVEAVPHAQVALVLGALVDADGGMSSMLDDRVTQAVRLWRAGKVDRVLVSGDHGTWAYDEPTTMRKVLQAHGVPADAIFEDHAGFDTWASMVRTREVFGVQSAVIVTQGFHLARAPFLADAASLPATGLSADLQDYGYQRTRSDIRELGSRVKAVLSTALHPDVLLGPPVPITGDGRSSWGPEPPPGTPPAGAP